MRWEHFGFKPHAFLAETFALVGFGIDEAYLNEIDFRPMRALGIEVPRRIWRVFAFAVDQKHLRQLYFPQGIHSKQISDNGTTLAAFGLIPGDHSTAFSFYIVKDISKPPISFIVRPRLSSNAAAT